MQKTIEKMKRLKNEEYIKENIKLLLKKLLNNIYSMMWEKNKKVTMKIINILLINMYTKIIERVIKIAIIVPGYCEEESTSYVTKII